MDSSERAEVARRGASLLKSALNSVALSSASNSSGTSLEQKVQPGDVDTKRDAEGIRRYKLATANWRKVATQATSVQDPWADVVESCPVERAEELVYDVASKQWRSHRLLVRINTEAPVAKGRMRECFRMKKIILPGASHRVQRANSDESHSSLQELKIQSIVRQLSGDEDVHYGADYTASDMDAWAATCKESICAVLHNLGRRTACRVRTKLGYNSVNYNHPTVLTVGEVMNCVHEKGQRFVELAFIEEAHALHEHDIIHLRTLIQRGLKDEECWRRGSLNFMAKRYMASKDDIRSVYEDDVIMQEVCKVLCASFNSHDPAPPKQIDMLHVGLIRLIDRPNKPCLGYESFIQGRYHKWNTNAGWTDTVTLRHTPHAFSFASYRETLGAMMVVDIQGINDLYTDPQVHTRDGEGFGEGNLGARGMALFLRKFRFDLNPVVQYMRYTPFAFLKGEQGEASRDEIEKFQAGQSYLVSQAWSKRRQASLQSSPSEWPDAQDVAFGQGVDIDTDAYGVPEFILDCSKNLPVGECPMRIRSSIPLKETAEAAVHAALAKLYDEDDERVVCDGVDPTKASFFHRWMAALAGCKDSMIICAEHTNTTASSVMNWYHAAAMAGSRAACLEALARVPQDDTLLSIFYMQKALTLDDGKTDAERKLCMETTQHELHAQLGAAFRTIGEINTSQSHFEQAADLALEAGDFKFHERYLEAMDAE